MYSRQGWLLYHVGLLCYVGSDASDGVHSAYSKEASV